MSEPLPPDPRLRIIAAVQEAQLKRLNFPPSDSAAERQYPFLWAWLTFTEVGDGYQKQPAIMSIQCDHGDWKASVTDGATGRSLVVRCAALGECFEALDKALGEPSPAWTFFRKRGPKIVRESAANGHSRNGGSGHS